jgi:hypothetical protein
MQGINGNSTTYKEDTRGTTCTSTDLLLAFSIFYYYKIDSDVMISTEIDRSPPCSNINFICTYYKGCKVNGTGVQTVPFYKSLRKKILHYNHSYNLRICYALMEFVDISPRVTEATPKILVPKAGHHGKRSLDNIFF